MCRNDCYYKSRIIGVSIIKKVFGTSFVVLKNEETVYYSIVGMNLLQDSTNENGIAVSGL